MNTTNMVDDTRYLERCPICGEFHAPDFMTGVWFGGWYGRMRVCNECLLHGLNDTERFTTCRECGEVCQRDDLSDVNDDMDFLVCEDCLEQKSDKYHQCPECGDWYTLDHMTRIGGRNSDTYVCESCLENNSYHCCEDCGDWFHEDDMTDVGTSQAYHWVCDRCRDDYWCQCEHCNEWFEVNCSDWYGYSDRLDQHLCCECEGELSSQIVDEQEDGYVHDYHWGREVDWYRDTPAHTQDESANVANLLSYGVEIEMAGGKFDAETMVDEGRDMWHYEHDGSLDDDGVELITQPCTLNYHKKRFGWGPLLYACSEAGYRSHDCTTCSCGFHVHIGRKNLSAMDELKLDVFINKYLPWWKKIARRTSGWAVMRESKSIKESSAEVRYKRGDHHTAVNHSNYNTVEIRIAKGTLRAETVLGTIELYDAAIHFLRGVGVYDLYSKRQETWRKFEEYVTARPKDYGEAIRTLARLLPKEYCPAAGTYLDRASTSVNALTKMRERGERYRAWRTKAQDGGATTNAGTNNNNDNNEVESEVA